MNESTKSTQPASGSVEAEPREWIKVEYYQTRPDEGLPCPHPQCESGVLSGEDGEVNLCPVCWDLGGEGGAP